MLKTFKRVLSAILTVAIVFFPLFDAHANGANIEELTETVDKDALSRTTGVIASGIYYISNVEYDKVVQIDDNADSPSESGAILELWGLDKGTDQQWNFTLLSTGYYRIQSVASGLAITAPTSKNESLTQETYSSTDSRQQWKITRTDDNLFTLSPKSNSSYYMSAGGGAFTSNGRNVELRSGQSDNKDEWNLLSTSKRYSQASLASSYASSLNDAVKEYYEQNAHAYGTTYLSINKDTFISELTSSNFFGAMLHGRRTELQIDGTKVISKEEISNIPDSSFDSVKVVILTACDSYEFVDVLSSKGVDVVIGFWGLVEQELGEYWTEKLVYALSCGNTVAYSLEYANDALNEAYLDLNPDYDEIISQITCGYYTGETMLFQRPCA